MNVREGRQCSKTGLWLVDAFNADLRVATRTRGPLDPPVRLSGDDPLEWNRFDTPGSTIYLADSEEVAFAEMLSTYALKLGEKHPLQKDADFLGMGLDEFIAEFAREWDERQTMRPGCLPRHWRDRRLLYAVALAGSGWWIDLETQESIAAVTAGVGGSLNRDHGLERLTLGTLHGELRPVTTMIATWVREQVLDDGSLPLGIRFRSKHGSGYCWAYWLRRRDDGLEDEPMSADPGQEIKIDRPALVAVSARMGIKLW